MFESEEIRLLPAHLQWRTVVPKQGESVKGWIVGPIQIHTVHFTQKASRPCRDKITKGKVLCYCANAPQSARQVGYQPLLTRDREKLVVLMCATTAAKVKMIAHGTPVEFWRSQKCKTGLHVKQVLAEDLGTVATGNAARMKPHDIRPYLLQILWQDAALISYFDKSHSATGHSDTIGEVTPVCHSTLGAPTAARDNAVSLISPHRKRAGKVAG